MIIKQIILAFFGSIFPVILFNIDRKKILWTGFCGAIGWALYLFIYARTKSTVIASFGGSVAVEIYSQILARKLKTPAMEFSVPGIFPLVPGITAYNTISLLVNHKYFKAFSKGMQTLGIGIAISFGIMLTSMGFRLFYRIINKKHKKY